MWFINWSLYLIAIYVLYVISSLPENDKKHLAWLLL